MKWKGLMLNIILLAMSLLLPLRIYTQDSYSEAQNRIIQQAQSQSTGAPIGLYLTLDTVVDPVRLLDTPADEELTGFEKIDPYFQFTLGYESQWLLRNFFRANIAFQFCGGFQFANNDMLSDYKDYFNYNLILGVNITKYLYLEFDSRGMFYFAGSYSHRINRNVYLLYQLDTKLRMWGNLYDNTGAIKDVFWQYSSFDFVVYLTPPVPQYLYMVSIETRLKVRLQNKAFNAHTHPDTGHGYNTEFPNWNELTYVSLGMQFDLWLTSYVALRPAIELVFDGFEITSVSVPFGFNLELGLHFLI